MQRENQTTGPNPFEGVNFGELELSLYRPRTMFSVILSWCCYRHDVAGPDSAIRGAVDADLARRAKAQLALFTELPPAPLEQGGGFGNAILGTLIMVGIATLISVPIGILTAVYLAQAQASKLAGRAVTICRQGAHRLPVHPGRRVRLRRDGPDTGGFSAVAGAIALSILMLPTIILTAEERHPHGSGENERGCHRHGRDQAPRPSGWCCCRRRCPAFSPASCWPWRAPPAKRRRCCSRRCSAITGSAQRRPRRPDAAHGIAGRAHLQLRRHALRQPG